MIGLAVVKRTPFFVSDEKVAPEPWLATPKDTPSQEGQRKSALTADRRGEQDRGGGLLDPHALGGAERGCRSPGVNPGSASRKTDEYAPGTRRCLKN